MLHYKISLWNSSQTEILRKLIPPQHPFQLSNNFDILHRAWQYPCHALCKIPKRLVHWEITYEQMRFCKMWVEDEFWREGQPIQQQPVGFSGLSRRLKSDWSVARYTRMRHLGNIIYGPWHWRFFTQNLNWMAIMIRSHPNFKGVIAVKFSTCHDSWAVLACAKICSDSITKTEKIINS